MNRHRNSAARIEGDKFIKPVMGVEKFQGRKPGPKVAICVLVHGNEIAGLRAHDTVLSLCGISEQGRGIQAGEVTLIVGNPTALTKRERYINHDLNRSFLEENLHSNETQSIEVQRFQEIEPFLREMDYVVDIHTSSQETPPFVIGLDERSETVDFMKQLGLGHVTSNWLPYIQGSLSEWPMRFNNNAISVAVECGLHEAEQSAETASHVVHRTLAACGVIEKQANPGVTPDAINHLRIVDAVRPKNNKNFRYVSDLSGISPVERSQLLAWDGDNEVRAPDIDNAVVLLPATEKHISKNPQDSAIYFGVMDT